MPDDFSPFDPPTAAVGPQSPFTTTEAPMVNPEAASGIAQQFLQQHRGDVAERTKLVDNLFSKQQLNVDNMTKMLDDTTNALKSSREGRSNLPMLAMAAGMLSGTGNLGQQLGSGLKMMVPTIEKQRNEDEDYNFKLMQMQMRRAGLENVPLEQQLAYQRALQTGDQSAIRAIESALIKTQGQTGKLDQAKDQADQKAIYNSLQEARRQTDSLYKDQQPDPTERDAEVRRRFREMAHAMGISEGSIAKFAPTMVEPSGTPGTTGPGGGVPNARWKGAFQTPGDTPKDIEDAKKLGLPPKPVGYIYDAMNPTDRLKQYQTERTDFEKDNKDWDKAQSQNMSQLKNFDEMERLMQKDSTSLGPKAGVIPNRLIPNTSKTAQELSSLFAGNTIHSVPQGQGAISDYERTLFNKAAPSMEHLPEVNRQLIAIQRDIIKDQVEKRAFATQYMGHYKTTTGLTAAWDRYIQSREGALAITGSDGKLTPNPNRVSWRDYFRREHGPEPERRAGGGQYAGGGPIKLGDEWDD